MTVDNGKLICSATTGKVLCSPTTGKLLYGIAVSGCSCAIDSQEFRCTYILTVTGTPYPGVYAPVWDTAESSPACQSTTGRRVWRTEVLADGGTTYQFNITRTYTGGQYKWYVQYTSFSPFANWLAWRSPFGGEFTPTGNYSGAQFSAVIS